jgi:plastocyanin
MKCNRWLYWSLATLCLAGTACSTEDPSAVDNGNGNGSGSGQEIRLLETRFNRSAVTISVGDTVRWINTRNIRHDVTPANPTQAGVWTAFTLDATGQTQSHTFNTAGTFAYSCTLHNGMDATITVTQ